MGHVVQMQTVSEARELEVYKLAFALSLAIHPVSLQFPKAEQYSLADQLRRASRSICANLAEGYDRQQYSKPDFGRFLMMASSSAAEVQVWLDYCHAYQYITQTQYDEWTDQYDKVNRMLHKLRRKLFVNS